ncbi:FEKKY domain-containing protein [Wenyingzhuangia sp. IMCC45467]
MNKRTKYIILALGILRFIFLLYNKNFALAENSLEPPELKYSKLFFGIGVLSIGIFFLSKKLRNLLITLAISGFTICLILNISLSIQIFESVRIGKIYAEYGELDTCEKMEKRFATDLKNKKIKYFQCLTSFNPELEKILKNEYNIETFGMNCETESEKECYNKLVKKYLKKEHNKSFIDNL